MGAVYGYSFVVTNLDVSSRRLPQRSSNGTDTAPRSRSIRDAKHGGALRHLPSG
jgi:hypothetical protein